MNCFVIMPFAPEFDDVYALIKTSVESVTQTLPSKCFRLDENRPAGRITDRLLNELNAADLCIADLTGCSPNVMWEVGYAMALRTPIVIITQSAADLPFDLKDMQSIRYDRGRLGTTLAGPLKRTVIDTLQLQQRIGDLKQPVAQSSQDSSKLIGELLTQVNDLKAIVSEAVNSWSQHSRPPVDSPGIGENLKPFEGHWLDTESRSHFFARIIDKELIVPYSYGADYELTAVFYGWERMNDYWFARFSWLESPISGFAFLRNTSVDTLDGSWWYDHDVEVIPRVPEVGSGYPLNLVRQPKSTFPAWAEQFLKHVLERGLPPNVRVHGRKSNASEI
jgi:hypothetical protein